MTNEKLNISITEEEPTPIDCVAYVFMSEGRMKIGYSEKADEKELAFLTSAIEKQMPKRVNNTQNLRIFRCPSCNIEIVILGASHRFCENCGQALDFDWSAKDV